MGHSYYLSKYISVVSCINREREDKEDHKTGADSPLQNLKLDIQVENRAKDPNNNFQNFEMPSGWSF